MNTPEPRTKRRWLAFSLRGMLVVITLAAVWLGYLTNQAIKQRRAVALIKQLGGEVLYDWELAKPSRRKIRSSKQEPAPPGPAWLRKLVGNEYFQQVWEIDLHERDRELPREAENLETLACLVHVREIDITGYAFSAKQLSFLANMHDLEELNLDQCVVRGNALVHLNSTQLVDLDITNSEITPAALRELGRMPSIEELSLEDTPVDPNQMRWLASLTKLRSLEFENMGITDATLAHLAELTQLRDVTLDGNPLTGEGLRHLARSQEIYRLSIEHCPLTDRGMASFPELANLKQLETEETSLTDTAIASLPTLPLLAMWDLSETKVTGTGFRRVAADNLPDNCSL